MIGLEGVKQEVLKLRKALFYTAAMSLIGLLGAMGACVMLMEISKRQMDYIVMLQEQINELKQ